MPREKLPGEQAATLIRPAAAQEEQKVVAAPPGEAGRILSLQRSVGNQVVQRLLARAPEEKPAEPAAPVQRQEPTEEEG